MANARLHAATDLFASAEWKTPRTTLLALCMVIALGGCVVATPYQSATESGDGFSEIHVGDDVWRVRFVSNHATTRETIQTYWLYHTAELSINRGFDGFQVKSEISFVRLDGQPVADNEQNYFLRTFVIVAPPINMGGLSGLGGFLGGAGSSPPTRLLVEGEIKMLKKPFDEDPPRVFDAHSLKASLDPYMKDGNCNVKVTAKNICPHDHDYLRRGGKI